MISCTSTRKLLYLNMSPAFDKSFDNLVVAELDGTHQGRVIVPIPNVNSGSVLRRKYKFHVLNSLQKLGEVHTFFIL